MRPQVLPLTSPRPRWGPAWWGAAALCAGTLALALSAPGTAYGQATLTPSTAIPGTIALALLRDCASAGHSVACNNASLRAIDAAHQAEGIGPLLLPPAYGSMSMLSEVVAVTNAERTSRHLPALAGPWPSFDVIARRGAISRQDPTGPTGTTWVSNLAEGFGTPLEADYFWMYDDGPGGVNAACSSTNSVSCWVHRDNILSPWPGLIGAAADADGRGPDGTVFAELIVKGP
jgi:hypothetical protein